MTLDRDVRAFGKARVQVRGNHHNFFFVHASQFADDVAHLVDFYGKTGLCQQCFHGSGALRLLKRRRGDLADLRLKLDHGGFVATNGVESGANRGLVQQFGGRLSESGRDQ